MNLWRLEWLRLVRTKRIIGLVGVWVFFGLLGPLTARYLAEILTSIDDSIDITLPQPVPADGLTQFISNGLQLGLLVVVIVGAAAFTIDSNAEMAIFLRSRVSSATALVTPRYVVTTAASVISFALGAALAVYATQALLGPLPVDAVLFGTLLTALYVAFALAVVVAAGGWLTSIAATVGVAVGVLLLLALTGLVDEIDRWSPSHLAGALDGLVRGADVADYLASAAITILAIPALVWVGVRGVERREL